MSSSGEQQQRQQWEGWSTTATVGGGGGVGGGMRNRDRSLDADEKRMKEGKRCMVNNTISVVEQIRFGLFTSNEVRQMAVCQIVSAKDERLHQSQSAHNHAMGLLGQLGGPSSSSSASSSSSSLVTAGQLAGSSSTSSHHHLNKRDPMMHPCVTATDPIMGPEGPNKVCGLSTCKKPWSTHRRGERICSGHLGYVDLEDFFYHPRGLQIAISILTVVCHTCGCCLMSETAINSQLRGLRGLARLNRMREIIENDLKKKDHIGSHQCRNQCPSRNRIIDMAETRNRKMIIFEDNLPGFGTTGGSSSKSRGKQSSMMTTTGTSAAAATNQVLTLQNADGVNRTTVMNMGKPEENCSIPEHSRPEVIYHILKSIPEYDRELIGLEVRPEALMIDKMLVNSNQFRPRIENNGSTEQTNPLTDWVEALAEEALAVKVRKFASQASLDVQKELLARKVCRLKARLDRNLSNRTVIAMYEKAKAEHLRVQHQFNMRNDNTAANGQHHCYFQAYAKVHRRVIELFEAKPDGTMGNEAVLNKGIPQMTKGKKGMMRELMVGKRGNYTARTTISPSPEGAKVTEIYLPRRFAHKLTTSEVVTEDNIELLREMAQQHKIFIVTPSSGHMNEIRAACFAEDAEDEGRKIAEVEKLLIDVRRGWNNFSKICKMHRIRPTLHVGDLVERSAVEGDWVSVGRFPSLWRQSCQAFQIKFWDEISIGLHISKVQGFNADFDGDEMNLMMPQTMEVRAEVAALMSGTNVMLADTNNAPVDGILYDGLTTQAIDTRVVTEVIPLNASELSDSDIQRLNALPKVWADDRHMYYIKASRDAKTGLVHIKIHREVTLTGELVADMVGALTTDVDFSDFHYRLMQCGYEPPPQIRSKEEALMPRPWPLYQARAVSSLAIPSDLSVKLPQFELDIRHGIMMPGSIFSKKSIGPFVQSNLIHIIAKQYGNARAHVFIDDLTAISYVSMASHGFTLGVEDCMFQQEMSRVEDVATKLPETYRRLTKTVHRTMAQEIPTDVLFYVSRTSAARMQLTKEIREIYATSPEYLDYPDFYNEHGLLTETGRRLKMLATDVRVQLKTLIQEFVARAGVLQDNFDQAKAMNNYPLMVDIERKIVSVLTDLRTKAGQIVQEYGVHADNGFVVSSKGAKGNVDNLVQVLAMLGQQLVQSQRPPNKMGNGTRAVVHYLPDDTIPEARGLCLQGFFEGICLVAYFFHLWAAREGPMATKLDSSVIGDATTRISKALEMLLAYPDGSVRDVNGNIIQYVYGGDGYASSRMEMHDRSVGWMRPSGCDVMKIGGPETKRGPAKQLPIDLRRIAYNLNHRHVYESTKAMV